MMYDVIIIGSGVMGLSVAKSLSESDLNIVVIDRDIPGMHASYKAGGMLGAQNEFTYDSTLFRLALRAQRLFEPLQAELKQQTGIDIEYQQSGLIKLAAAPEDNEQVLQQQAFLHSYHPAVRLLSEHELSDITHHTVTAPHLAAMHIPTDHQINANKYTKALLKSIIQNGVERYYQTEVTQVEAKDTGYQVHTDQHSILTAKQVIVAGGAWSNELVNEPELDKAVTGVKGEVVLVEHKDLKLDTTIFMTNGCYIVPKAKHRFLIGATSYVNDYSVGVSNEGKDWLLSHTIKHIPDIAQSQILKTWSGIRPYTRNEQPIMDEIQPGLFVITGHYRNGILLSPLIGQLMSEWVLNHERPESFTDFQFKRGERHEMHN